MRATTELNRIQWRTSSYSNGQAGGECVEVGFGASRTVPVRDSKDPGGPVLTFTPAAWVEFLAAVREGMF
jgi:hypothetical protein